MAIDFLKTADFLQEELQTFYRILRRGGDEGERRAAIERLCAVIHRVEPFTDDPGEEWVHLPLEQRWGYLRVVSHMGTATHELKRIGRNA